MNAKNTRPELLAPAGGFDAALAAFQYGADAVYLGLPRFSARADADNITFDRLRVLLAYARTFTPRKKIYVTFNTLVCDAEVDSALESLSLLADFAPDGVIVQDLGVARLVREHFPPLALHASTQLAAHNLDGVLALKELGFTRVVLARELTCDEIRHIAQDSGIEIEVFIHGALCYSYSGLCFFSSHATGRSGNRGRCAYCCREGLTADADGRAPTRYPFSMKDLALAPMLDAVVATGACSLKIEGRMKSPLYVACVTHYYRRKLDGLLPPEEERKMAQDLQTVFSRPWTTLYAAGRHTVLKFERSKVLKLECASCQPTAAAPPDRRNFRNLELSNFRTSPVDPMAVGHRGAHIGHADAVLQGRDGTRWLRFTSNRALEKHDGLQVELPDSGKPFGCAVNLLRQSSGGILPAKGEGRHGRRQEDKRPRRQSEGSENYPMPSRPVITLPAGATVEVALPDDAPSFIPKGAPVFCSASQAVRRAYGIRSVRESELSVGRPADFTVGLSPSGIAVTASAKNTTADTFLPVPLTPSRQPGQTAAAVRKAFERLGDTAWTLGALTVHDPQHLYAPPSKLNEARRDALAALTDAWEQGRKAIVATASSRCPSHSAAGMPPLLSLKLRVDAPLFSAAHLRAGIILAIGHTPYPELAPLLAQWKAQRLTGTTVRQTTDGINPVNPVNPVKNAEAHSHPSFVLALPLISRDAERAELRQTVARLIGDGWTDWECADLAGCHLLRSLGIIPVSSDWSLYALNRVAVAELAHLGVQSFALSPELDLATVRSLAGSAPAPELIVFQHTPLFISETPPSSDSPALFDRRGRAFSVNRVDDRWVTVSEKPLCLAGHLAETNCTRFRIDLSWSPVSAIDALPEITQALNADCALAGTHTGNLMRGLA